MNRKLSIMPKAFYLIVFINIVQYTSAQTGYDYLKWYGKAEYSQTTPISAYPSNFILDTFNNGYGCIPINGIAKLGVDVYESSKGVGGAIVKYSNKGNLLWKIPIYGANLIFNNQPKLRNGQFVIAFSCGSKCIIYKDTFPVGNIIVACDSNGKVDYVKPIPVCAYSTFSSNNNTTLLTIKVIKAATYFGTYFDPGIYCLEISKLGTLISYTLLASSIGSSITGIVTQANDSLLYFTGFAKKGDPFIGKNYQVRAKDSQTHLGIYAADIFLACLYKNGNLKWMQRIDTMCIYGNVNSMTLTKNGSILWCPEYYKTGLVLGKRAFVKFPGGSYCVVAILNAENGLTKKLYSVDTVGGGTDNSASVYEMSGKNTFVMKVSGSESFKLWKGIPDSAKNILAQLSVIRFDADGTYFQINPMGTANISLNTFNPGYGGYLGFFHNASIKVYQFSTFSIPNVLGNDYFFMCISIFKPNMSGNPNSTSKSDRIYPNPILNEINIQSQTTYSQIELCNLQGKRIVLLSLLNNATSIPDIPPGIYFARAIDAKQNATAYCKVVKL